MIVGAFACLRPANWAAAARHPRATFCRERRKQFFNPSNRKELLWYTGSVSLYWLDDDASEL